MIPYSWYDECVHVKLFLIVAWSTLTVTVDIHIWARSTINPGEQRKADKRKTKHRPFLRINSQLRLTFHVPQGRNLRIFALAVRCRYKFIQLATVCRDFEPTSGRVWPFLVNFRDIRHEYINPDFLYIAFRTKLLHEKLTCPMFYQWTSKDFKSCALFISFEQQ